MAFITGAQPGMQASRSSSRWRIAPVISERTMMAARNWHMIFTPYGFPEISDIYLKPTSFLDCDDPVVIEFARRAVASEADNVRKAVRLFYAVRDGFRYDPFAIWLAPGAFKASTVIKQGYGFCITKAVLLAAVRSG